MRARRSYSAERDAGSRRKIAAVLGGLGHSWPDLPEAVKADRGQGANPS